MPSQSLKTYTKITFRCRWRGLLLVGYILSSHFNTGEAKRYYTVKSRDPEHRGLYRVYPEQLQTIYAPPPPAKGGTPC